jgi:hypothetical protein
LYKILNTLTVFCRTAVFAFCIANTFPLEDKLQPFQTRQKQACANGKNNLKAFQPTRVDGN